jgi:hypothetical protein
MLLLDQLPRSFTVIREYHMMSHQGQDAAQNQLHISGIIYH